MHFYPYFLLTVFFASIGPLCYLVLSTGSGRKNLIMKPACRVKTGVSLWMARGCIFGGRGAVYTGNL